MTQNPSVASGYRPGSEDVCRFIDQRASPVQTSDNLANLPKISIVMPCFNQLAYVERSILSVLNQNYPNLELIVADGGSTDGTLAVLERYRTDIAHLLSEPDKGQSDALNKGFALASGDIFGWLNSDDIYAPGALARAVEVFEQRKNARIVYGDWIEIDEEDQVVRHQLAIGASSFQLQYEGFCMNAQAMFWRREVHDRFSGFDVALYNTMDYQMMMEFSLAWPPSTFARVDDVLGGFRRYEGQKTGASVRTRVDSEHRSLADRYGYMDKYQWQGRVKYGLARVRRALWFMRRAGFLAMAKEVSRSIRQG